MSSSLLMRTDGLTIISHVLNVVRHLHMLQILGKQPCLSFTATFLCNLVEGTFEIPVKNSAILLMVTIAFFKKDTNAINHSVSIFVSREEYYLINTRKLPLSLLTHIHNTLLPGIYFLTSNLPLLFKHCNFSSKIAENTRDTILWPSAANFFG